MEESDNGVFLRTVLRKDIFDKLTTFAKLYSTGIGKWDYGVAIQILLDFFEQHSTVAQINGKLDFLLSSVTNEVEEQPKKEETHIEMLGGERIQK
jgi:hypothetical protein